jgi:hypothetical protein
MRRLVVQAEMNPVSNPSKRRIERQKSGSMGDRDDDKTDFEPLLSPVKFGPLSEYG